MLKTQYQIFYVKGPWTLTDEKTGEVKSGYKICYGDLNIQDEPNFRGMPVSTKSVSRDLANKLTKLPAKYEVTLKPQPMAKGGMDYKIMDFSLIAS